MKKYILAFFGLLILVTAGTCADQLTAIKAADQTSFIGTPIMTVKPEMQGGLSLEISTDRSEFVLGEPVVLYVTLKNAGSGPVQVMPRLEPDYQFVEYFVKGPDGAESVFLPWAYKDYVGAQTTLQPGDSISGVAKIFYGGNGWTFKVPGTYRLRAVYENSASSQEISINVKAPTDDAGQRSSQIFLSSDEVGKFLLFEGGDHLQDGISKLKTVADQMPGTPHAFYANYALGVNMMRDFANFQTNSLRAADPQMAVSYLQKIETQPVSFYYSMETTVYLSRAYDTLGQPSQAELVKTNFNLLASQNFQVLAPLYQQEMEGRLSTPMIG